MSFLTTFSDEASKTYKDAARTATTGPINLLSAPASIGSVSLNLNDRVLVKDQANAEENGIYVFKGAGSPMVRSTDANSDREVLPNMLISVSEGDYEDKIFELTTNGPISLGVTPLSFGLAILPIDLTTDVVGVLPVANGGTNRASWTEGRVVFAGASGSALTEDSDLNWDNSNKRLGIGTTAPADKLHVVGGMPLIISNSTTDNAEKSGRLTTTHYSVSEEPLALIGGSAFQTTNSVLIGGGYSSTNAATAIHFYTAANTTTTTGSERMRIDSLGNVGIGTTTPGTKLAVNNGAGTIADILTLQNDSTNATPGRGSRIIFTGTGNSTIASVTGETTTSSNTEGAIRLTGVGASSFVAINTNSFERMRIDSDGRVLIGTTVPAESFIRFQLAANASPGMFIDGYEDSGNGPGIYARKARGVQSAPTSTQVHDVLLGLSGRLYGTTGFTNTSRASILLRAAENCTDIAQGTYITFRTTAIGTTTMLDRMRISDNGDVGIGTATPTQKLEVAGNAKAQGLLLQSRHNLTGAVTVLSNDYYVGCNSSGGAVTVALQSAATAKQGRKLVIKAESSLANVTINAAAGETIDGSASHVLNVSYESVTLVCNGANAWFIV